MILYCHESSALLWPSLALWADALTTGQHSVHWLWPQYDIHQHDPPHPTVTSCRLPASDWPKQRESCLLSPLIIHTQELCDSLAVDVFFKWDTFLWWHTRMLFFWKLMAYEGKPLLFLFDRWSSLGHAEP